MSATVAAYERLCSAYNKERANASTMRAALQRIAGSDYRGNRSTESQIAQDALDSLVENPPVERDIADLKDDPSRYDHEREDHARYGAAHFIGGCD